jgi:prepilin-type N-terminal cleavage/methylation domain-containing protein
MARAAIMKLPILKKTSGFKSAFTLVELMIVLSVTATLSAIGIAGYIDFNRSQLVSQTAKKIVQDLRLAQSLALNIQKPDVCGKLESYTFSLSAGTYSISADCFTPAYNKNPVKSQSLGSGFDLTGFSKIKFMILHQGIEFTGGRTLTVSAFGKSKVITVDEGGMISVQE